ncbi:hypothetical protein TcasGA2_TC000702 [Tribolium castaneum]|uniref:Uncharacterized protein n=1 Tax=Tribolium castaneum TaxID=7070 RepID=D6W8T7_TRICA|nr:hypothetical protein TcasGA2_TC000702 [Tribolium castaneum]
MIYRPQIGAPLSGCRDAFFTTLLERPSIHPLNQRYDQVRPLRSPSPICVRLHFARRLVATELINQATERLAQLARRPNFPTSRHKAALRSRKRLICSSRSDLVTVIAVIMLSARKVLLQATKKQPRLLQTEITDSGRFLCRTDTEELLVASVYKATRVVCEIDDLPNFSSLKSSDALTNRRQQTQLFPGNRLGKLTFKPIKLSKLNYQRCIYEQLVSISTNIRYLRDTICKFHCKKSTRIVSTFSVIFAQETHDFQYDAFSEK